MRLTPLLYALSLTALAAGSMTMLPTPTQATQEGSAQTESQRLHALFAQSDEDSLRRDPIIALVRGDLRYAHTLGNLFTDAYNDEARSAAESELATLKAIDRSKLNPTDQIAYDVFQYNRERALSGLAPEILALTAVRPIDHFYGVHIDYPDVSSGQGIAPFNTVEDYENNLKRHRDYIAILGRAIGLFRKGMESGVVQPKLVVNNVIDQLDLQIAQGVEGSTFYHPVTKFPQAVGSADQARLKSEYSAIIRDGILPAYVELRDFLKNEYLPVARDSVGLQGMKGGDTLYAHLIQKNTTLPLTAEDIHKTGLAEVARITTEMEAIKNKVGFKGTLLEFFDHLRTDSKFQPKTKEELRLGYEAIGRKVDERVKELFSVTPKTAFEIRPVPEYREKSDAGGSYASGTPDGSRPGVFYYNTYDLPSRYTWGMETLYLHEAVPGHHFQISLAQENEALPNFMRFGGNTAFIEGWALYAETLWAELGVESDPYQRMGGLSDEMLRAMRLVVDTGIHAKGWSRDQAIEYMLTNSPMGKTDATAEVERYIAIPGQALAYKTGSLKIQALKAKAQKELGAKFDIREFHDQVLNTGSLPLVILERKIESWIASKKG